MKLLRHGPMGDERPGLLDDDGQVRDLSGIVADIDGTTISPEGLRKLAAIDPGSLPAVPAGTRLGCPVGKVGKFVAIGLNYSDHAAEANLPEPKEPIIFMKATSCIVGPDDDVVIPRGSTRTDWEIELGIVIGSRASYVSKASALDHVAGYTIVNDVSEREYQMERGGTWDKGKCCDTFGPIGPWLVTADEIADAQDLAMRLEVNGEARQTGTTAKMIFDVATIVSYVTEFMTLLPGDVICTGTPPGVGMGMRPQTFLKADDVMTLSIAGLGRQRQQCVAWSAT